MIFHFFIATPQSISRDDSPQIETERKRENARMKGSKRERERERERERGGAIEGAKNREQEIGAT